MNRFENITKPLRWSMALLLVAFVAGCGGGNGTPGAGSGAGAVCTGASCVNLKTAGNYAILAEAAITNVPTSKVIGNVGVFPASAAIGLTCPEVIGVIYSPDATGPSCKVTDGTGLNIAVNDKLDVYNYAFGQTATSAATTNIGAGTLDATTVPSPLAPGVYVWGSAVTIPTDLTLAGTATGVWIFHVGGTLDLGANVILSGALPQNIFWVASDIVTIAPGKHMEGVVLSASDIVLQTGATANGRLLSKTQVTLDHSTVTQPL